MQVAWSDYLTININWEAKISKQTSTNHRKYKLKNHDVMLIRIKEK